MSEAKKYLPEYLSFTRKERWGILVIVVLIIFFTTLPFLLPFFIKSKPLNTNSFEKDIARLNVKEDTGKTFTKRKFNEDNYTDYPEPGGRYNQSPKGQLFYFDPNSLSEEGWIKLGIREKTASTIHNYISKGGRFYKPEDISKIWGLHEDEVKRLLPYVRIEGKPASDYDKYPDREDPRTYTKRTYNIIPCDVNSDDTAAFIALPGIGSKLAARIVAFREKLGGFYKIEQVAETYGLPDSTFQKIKSRLVMGVRDVKKLDINKASVDELKAHPYIRYQLANAIVQYRTQHGSFAATQDIKKILLVTDDLYGKISPYITIK